MLFGAVSRASPALRMELSYVSIRHRLVSILFWSAVAFAAIAIVLPFGTDAPMPISVALLAFSAAFTLWIHWQNGRGGFGTVRGMHPTYETRARLSPGQWLVLLLIMMVEAGVLSFVLVS